MKPLCLALLAAVAAACSEPTALPDPALVAPNADMAVIVGSSLSYDASQNGVTFSGPGLQYTIGLSRQNGTLRGEGARIVGTPTEPGVIGVEIRAVNAEGAAAVDSFSVAVFAAGLPQPGSLGAFAYANVALPEHFRVDPIRSPLQMDNTPASNPTTDAGAALGRVLFYDTRLSRTDAVSCGSCHVQALGFGDSVRLSRGFAGAPTRRHSMGLANARFYAPGRFFWDERAQSLEQQTLEPIQSDVEMGLSLPELVVKLRLTPFYPPLFQAAFGSPEITTDRVSRALAQFVRSMISYRSRFDSARAAGPGNLASVLTPAEVEGRNVFQTVGRCALCHQSDAQVAAATHNIGLPGLGLDQGAGGGRFKAPSLRNIAVRPPYMHDGRFRSLREVIDHYDGGIFPALELDPILRGPNGGPIRLNLTNAQKDALIAYLNALTDQAFLSDPKLSNPFR